MPILKFEEILDSITMHNIDDALYFYSSILDMIMQKKKKYQQRNNVTKKIIKIRHQEGNNTIKKI